jgi:hypothetical protein
MTNPDFFSSLQKVRYAFSEKPVMLSETKHLFPLSQTLRITQCDIFSGFDIIFYSRTILRPKVYPTRGSTACQVPYGRMASA